VQHRRRRRSRTLHQGGLAMNAEEMRTLYAFNTWANARILDTAARLTPNQLHANVGASYPSVLTTLEHTMLWQGNWLARWREDAGAVMRTDLGNFRDLATLRAAWAEIDAETHQFVQTLDEAALARSVAYVNDRGETWAYPLWQMLVHQVNHATQHRSEVAVMLTQFGHSPGWLDFLVFIDERATAIVPLR
jgi:uncharacterized damage-inducible protein DinB